MSSLKKKMEYYKKHRNRKNVRSHAFSKEDVMHIATPINATAPNIHITIFPLFSFRNFELEPLLDVLSIVV